MCPERGAVTGKQVDAPEAVFLVDKEEKPRTDRPTVDLDGRAMQAHVESHLCRVRYERPVTIVGQYSGIPIWDLVAWTR